MKKVILYILVAAIGTIAAHAGIIGDVNNDGKVNITDAVALNNFLHGNIPPVFIRPAADVNGSGTISITDAVGIINIIHSAGNSSNANSTGMTDETYTPQ